MSEIIPHILPKGEPGEDAQYPFSYSDIEACFTKWNIATIYLQLNFNDLNISSGELRKASEQSGRYLIAYFHMGIAQPPGSYSFGKVPWQDVEEPFLVSTNIYAVEECILDSMGFSGAELGEMLAQTITELEPPPDAPLYKYRLTMTLLTKKQAVEFRWELPDKAKGSKVVKYPLPVE